MLIEVVDVLKKEEEQLRQVEAYRKKNDVMQKKLQQLEEKMDTVVNMMTQRRFGERIHLVDRISPPVPNKPRPKDRRIPMVNRRRGYQQRSMNPGGYRGSFSHHREHSYLPLL